MPISDLTYKQGAALAYLAGLPWGEAPSRPVTWHSLIGRQLVDGSMQLTDAGRAAVAELDALNTRPLRSDKHRCEQPAKCWADPDCPVYSSRGASGQPTTTTAPNPSCGKCGSPLPPCYFCNKTSLCGEGTCQDHVPDESVTTTGSNRPAVGGGSSE